MKLMTKALERRFKEVGSQDEVKDPIIIARFFNPTGVGTWYASEYDPENRTFFGYVSIFGDWNDEWVDSTIYASQRNSVLDKSTAHSRKISKNLPSLQVLA